MMKVYVVHEEDYEYFEILGVFDDKQKAEKMAEIYKNYCNKNACVIIEEYILNQLTQDTNEKILLNLDKLKNELLGDK